jgi:hypothetical protein
MQRPSTLRLFLLVLAALVAGSGISVASANDSGLIRCAEYQLIGKFDVTDGASSLEVDTPDGHSIKIRFKKATNQILLNGLNGFIVNSRVIITNKLGVDTYSAKLKTVTVLPDGAKEGMESVHVINKTASCGGS